MHVKCQELAMIKQLSALQDITAQRGLLQDIKIYALLDLIALKDRPLINYVMPENIA